MTNTFKITGYHGTFKDNVNNILSEGYTPKMRDNHWLGQGIYFYDDIELAKWFASRRYAGKHGKQISVIKSLLSTIDEKVLDLNTRKGVDFVFEKISEIIDQLNIVFDKDNEIKNRCILLDIIKEYHQIDIIIKTFQTTSQTYGKVNIEWFEKNYFPTGFNYNETQICASNNECIVYKTELPSDDNYNLPNRIWFKKE